MSTTFNVSDLSPFDVGDEDSRTNHFDERGNDRVKDVEQVATKEANDRNLNPNIFDDRLHINGGTITRSKAKKMKEALNVLIEDAKAKATIEVDLTKSKSWRLINQIQALDEPI